MPGPQNEHDNCITLRENLGHKKPVFLVTGTETIACPKCLGELKAYDRRKRGCLCGDGTRKVYRLRRLRCRKCSSLHAELPDFMVPFKRYSTQAIQSVAEGKKVGAPFEERTRQKVMSWYRKAMRYLEGVWHQQVLKGFASPDSNPTFVSLVRAAVNSGNWPYHPFGRFAGAF